MAWPNLLAQQFGLDQNDYGDYKAKFLNIFLHDLVLIYHLVEERIPEARVCTHVDAKDQKLQAQPVFQQSRWYASIYFQQLVSFDLVPQTIYQWVSLTIIFRFMTTIPHRWGCLIADHFLHRWNLWSLTHPPGTREASRPFWWGLRVENWLVPKSRGYE